jgi:hypothetical protein
VIAGFTSTHPLLDLLESSGANAVGGIAPEGIAHLSQCDACRTLVLACQPSAKQRERFKKWLQKPPLKRSQL